jgi:nitrogenase molybdenum-iron protein alpha/beta subunit
VPSAARVPFVEHGFPSQRRHALSERPFLGFQGWITLVDELARALLDGMARADRPAPR